MTVAINVQISTLANGVSKDALAPIATLIAALAAVRTWYYHP